MYFIRIDSFMISTPLVSAIIPNYNHASYIGERIDSILNQTYSNIEVIILDDCSTDNSLDIINYYSTDKRISAVVRNDANSGSPFSQWRKGISMAKGDLIWIAESDDSCATTFLEELLDWYISNDLVMAFSVSRKMDSNGSLGDVVQKGITQNMVMKGNDYISNCISLITNASSAIFSRSCALKIDNNYYDYKGTGDWLFWTGIASQGQVGILSKPLNYYRVHDQNTTSKMFSNGRDFYELKKVYSYLFSEGYWDRWNYMKNIARKMYAIKYLQTFDNDNIRIDLIKEWNEYPIFNSIFCFLMKGKSLIQKIIK